MLKNVMEGCNTLVASEIEDFLGLSFHSLNLSSADVFIDNYEGTGEKVSQVRNTYVYDNSHPIRVGLMKNIGIHYKAHQF